jgi:DNA primase
VAFDAEHLNVEALLRRLGIEAKRQGREWVAMCPNAFHADRKPSWKIRDEPGSRKHGWHHCWPCGFGGSPVDLVIELVDVEDWRAAQAWLEGELVETDKPLAALLEVKVAGPRRRFVLPAGVDVVPLSKWVSQAREYAVSRGLTEAQVDRWRVGYAAEGRLSGRIVFVKRSGLGVDAGYSARTFVDSRTRYLEAMPWEHPLPDVVFGEEHWPPLAERRTILVAEGAINALAIERAAPGYPIAALSGSQLYAAHAWKLATFPEVVLLSDPDAAGDKLAKATADALARHTAILRVTLPTGTDAATVPPAELGGMIRECLSTYRPI